MSARCPLRPPAGHWAGRGRPGQPSRAVPGRLPELSPTWGAPGPASPLTLTKSWTCGFSAMLGGGCRRSGGCGMSARAAATAPPSPHSSPGCTRCHPRLAPRRSGGRPAVGPCHGARHGDRPPPLLPAPGWHGRLPPGHPGRCQALGMAPCCVPPLRPHQGSVNPLPSPCPAPSIPAAASSYYFLFKRIIIFPFHCGFLFLLLAMYRLLQGIPSLRGAPCPGWCVAPARCPRPRAKDVRREARREAGPNSTKQTVLRQRPPLPPAMLSCTHPAATPWCPQPRAGTHPGWWATKPSPLAIRSCGARGQWHGSGGVGGSSAGGWLCALGVPDQQQRSGVGTEPWAEHRGHRAQPRVPPQRSQLGTQR